MDNGLVRNKPLYRQLGSRLQERILSGELAVGDRLPTTQQLAEQFGVTIQTAQQAAKVLSERGLIERIPGRGTFVSNRVTSRTIGIVFGANVFGDPKALFFQSLYGMICGELRRMKWNAELYFPSDDKARERMFFDLEQAVANDRLRAVIPLCSSDALAKWLDEHPNIPRPIHAKTPSQVDPHASNIYRGTTYLLDRGYRRVAVVAHTATTHPDAVERMRAEMALAYDERGLKPQATFQGGAAGSHADGVAQAQAILDGPGDAPDAFLVLNDQGASGVIFELLCRGCHIPADVGVMALANKGITIPSPVPLTRFENDPLQNARSEIEALMAVLEDRAPNPVSIEAQLVVGESCGERMKAQDASQTPEANQQQSKEES